MESTHDEQTSTADQADLLQWYDDVTGSDELHAMFEGEDAASTAMHIFYAEGLMTTTVALKAHHSFIQAGRAYELMQDRLEHVEQGFKTFEQYMWSEFRLPAELIHNTIVVSRIARKVLAEKPGLFLHETFIKPVLQVVALADDADEGIREAADLVLAVAEEYQGVLSEEVVRIAAREYSAGRAA